MLSTRFNPVSQNFEKEFYTRIKYNFKVHVLLCLKGVNWNRQDILQKIYKLEGFRYHKAARYGRHWIHIHMKFTEAKYSENAVNFFTKLSPHLIAVCVDDLLRDWFSLEMRSGHNKTYTIVDIVGATPKPMNFLTENLLKYVLKDFGQPFVSPYTAAVKETHVQVLFHSMTEALAACMAFGHWYKLKQRTDDFAYRVRINPSEYEASLISISGGTPEDTFKLDYFMAPKPQISAAKVVCGNEKNENSQYFKRSDFQHKIMHNSRKPNSFQDNLQFPQIGMPQLNIRSPVMCVPVLTPMNRTYTQAFVVTGQQIDEDMSEAFMLHTACVEAVEPGTLTVTDDPEEMRVYSSSRIYESSESSPSCSYQSISQHDVYQENIVVTNSTQAFNIPRPVSMKKFSQKRSNLYTGNSLVFERSKW